MRGVAKPLPTKVATRGGTQGGCAGRKGREGEWSSGSSDLDEPFELEMVCGRARARGKRNRTEDEGLGASDNGMAPNSALYEPLQVNVTLDDNLAVYLSHFWSQDQDNSCSQDSGETTLSTAWRLDVWRSGEGDEVEESSPVERLLEMAELGPSEYPTIPSLRSACSFILILVDVIRYFIIEKQADILLIDENDTFSMTLAFAAMRRSFDGIWCSRTDQAHFRPFDLPERLRENHIKSMCKFVVAHKSLVAQFLKSS